MQLETPAPVANPFAALVGLRACNPTPPAGMRFVDDLPDISAELLENVSRDTYAQLFGKVSQLAFERLCEMVKDGLLPRATFDEQLYRSAPAQLVRADTVAPSARWQGWQVFAPASRYCELRLNSVIVHAANSGASSLGVFDLDTGERLLTQALTLTTGRNEVAVGKAVNLSVGRANLLIAIDCTAVALRQTISDGWNDQSGQLARAYNLDLYGTRRETFDLDAVKTEGLLSSVVEEDLVFSSTTAAPAVDLDLELRGSIERFVAASAPHLASIYRDLCAALILDAKLGSPEINLWAKSNLEFTREKRGTYFALVEGALAQRLPGLYLGGDSLVWKLADAGGFSITVGSLV